MSWADDKTLRIWDITTTQCNAVLKGHEGSVKGALVLPDGRRVVSWADDKTLRIWDITTTQCNAVLKGHEGSVKGALVLPDGRRVVSWAEGIFSRDHTLRIWNLESVRCDAVLEGHGDEIDCAFALSGGRILSWSNPLALSTCRALIHAPDGKLLHSLHIPSARIVRPTPDGRLIVDDAGNIVLYQPRIGKELLSLQQSPGG